METKVCTKCKIEKDICNFTKKGNGLASMCKSCKSEYDKEYRLKNDSRIKEYNKNNAEKISKQRKEYRQKNKEQLKTKRLQSYQENKEIINERKKEYRKKSKEKIKIYNHNYRKKKKQTDPLFRLKHLISNMIRQSFKRYGYTKNSKTHEILGCSYEEFKHHIESQWEDWMSWDNHGLYNGELNYGWDIDHVIPSSSAKTEKDVYSINHYTNLKPLCSYVNRYVKRNNT